MNLNRATNNLQRILNYPDNYNNSVLACAERVLREFQDGGRIKLKSRAKRW